MHLTEIESLGKVWFLLSECWFLASTNHHDSIYAMCFKRGLVKDLKAGISVFCKRNVGDTIWYLHYLEIFLYFSVSVRYDGREWSGQSGEDVKKDERNIFFFSKYNPMSVLIWMYYYNGYVGCIELTKTKLTNKRYLLTGGSEVCLFLKRLFIYLLEG